MSHESYGSGAPDDTGKADAARSAVSDTAHTARQQASDVAHSAKESGQHLVDEARIQAKDVTREAGQQVRSLLGQGREELTSQASQQQKKLAGGLRSFSSELGAMADGTSDSAEPGLATDLARNLAERTDAVAGWLDDREPGALLDEVKRFARNRPGTFLAIAAGAGLVVGRLTRGMKDAHADDDAPGTAATRSTGTGTYGTAGTYGTTGAAYGTTGTAYGTTGTTYGTGAVHGSAAGASAGAGYADAGAVGTGAGDPTAGVERRSVSEGFGDATTRSTLGGATGTTGIGDAAGDQPTERLDLGRTEGSGGAHVADRPWTEEGEQR